MLRQKDLCPEPSKCPDVLNVDPRAGPGALPCDECPRQRLSEYLASPLGQLLSCAIDMDFALQNHLMVTMADVPYHVFLLLRQLAEERDKYQIEEIKNVRKKQ